MRIIRERKLFVRVAIKRVQWNIKNKKKKEMYLFLHIPMSLLESV